MGRSAPTAGAVPLGVPVSANGAELQRILHVSADFPDPIEPAKTPVIRSLLELTSEQFDHRVISLNRRTPGLADLFGGAAHHAAFEWGEAREYRAPPLGIFHAAILRRLGAQLAEELAPNPPALLVGHKLTIEGLVVAEAARRLGRPFAITIQGNSDTKILAARPDLARQFAEVFHRAAAVFAFAPWSLAEVERRLGKRSVAGLLIPCPTDLDTPLTPVGAGVGLLSAFHLRHHRNKNLAGIGAGLKLLRAEGEDEPFTLLGGGDEAEAAQCQSILHGISDTSVVTGLGRNELRQAMNRAIGFVLPSHRESFGLVFIEALFAGLPVVYPENRAIAGWFENLPFAIPVDPRNPQAIAAAIKRLVTEEKLLKQSLAGWQHTPHARKFTRPHIAAEFAKGLRKAAASQATQLQTAAE